jgi:hypothetical protein
MFYLVPGGKPKRLESIAASKLLCQLTPSPALNKLPDTDIDLVSQITKIEDIHVVCSNVSDNMKK